MCCWPMPRGSRPKKRLCGRGLMYCSDEVALRVAAPRQQLLALCGGGGEAVRVGRSVQPVGRREEEEEEEEEEGERRACEKKRRRRRCYFLSKPQTTSQTSHSPSHLLTAAASSARHTFSSTVQHPGAADPVSLGSQLVEQQFHIHWCFPFTGHWLLFTHSYYFKILLTCRNCHGNL